MHRLSALPFAASLLLLSTTAFATVHPHRHSTAHAMVRRTTASSHAHAGHFAEHSVSASISPERATEIQAALIQHGYLTGDPTGSWDAASVAAMQKMQSDNGWQTKLVPDSRALIKLGLGPSASAVATSPDLSASAAAPTSAQTF